VSKGPLYDATTEVHHKAEHHPFMRRVVAGEIKHGEWAQWLGFQQALHETLDPMLPACARRAEALDMDMAASGFTELAPALQALADGFVADQGACYVLTGAHFRGGAVLRKKLEPIGFSCQHMRFDDPRAVEAYLVELRGYIAAANGARGTFSLLTEAMGAINVK